MRLDAPAINPDSVTAKIGRSYAQARQGRRRTIGYQGLGAGDSIGSILWGALTGAVGTAVEVGKSLVPQAILQATGATDQINSLLAQVAAYRQGVYSRILALDSVLARQIPPMLLSNDPNIRQTGMNLKETATTLRNTGTGYYGLLIKNEGELRTILTQIQATPSFVTSALATIQRIVSEAGVVALKGKDFQDSFNAFMSEFQREYSRVYQTTPAGVVSTAVAALPEDISKAITQAGAAIKSYQPWLIPGLIGGVALLFLMRSRR